MLTLIPSRKSHRVALAALAVLYPLLVQRIFVAALTILVGTGDEYSLLFQAEIFASLKFWAPAPPLAEFFPSHWIAIEAGKWFAIYPPGYPALLAPAMRLGHPELVPALVSTLTLLLFHRLTAFLSGEERIAWVVTLLLGLSPTFIFHSASFYSHTPAACLFMLDLILLRRVLETPSTCRGLALGASIGLGLLVRPYTTALLAIPIAGALLARGRRALLGAGIAVSVSIAAMIAYSLILQGSATPAYVQANLGPTGFAWHRWNLANVLRLASILEGSARWLLPIGWFQNLRAPGTSYRIFSWFPVLLALTGAIVALRGGRQRAMHAVAFSAAASLLLGHFWFGEYGGRYGERLMFEALPIVLYAAVVAIAAIAERLRWRFLVPAAAIALLALQARAVTQLVWFYREDNGERMAIYEQMETQQIRDGIVFLKEVPAHDPSFYTRNDPYLRGPLLVLDLGNHNVEMRRRFPDKPAYMFGRVAPRGFGLTRLP